MIYFLHGLESGPDGYKIQMMRRMTDSLGLVSIAPDFRGNRDPQLRAAQVLKLLNDESDLAHSTGRAAVAAILVGSSLGGFVAAQVAALAPERVAGLFLLCPAFDLPNYPLARPAQNLRGNAVQLVHGRHDEVVPMDTSLRAGSDWQASVLVLEDDHTLHVSSARITAHLQAWLSTMLSTQQT